MAAKVIADQSCFLDTLWSLIFFLLFFFFFSIFSSFSFFCYKMSKLRCSAFASVILPAAVESCTKRSLILCETITIFFSFSYSGFSVNFLRQSKVGWEKKVERLILFSLLSKYYLWLSPHVADCISMTMRCSFFYLFLEKCVLKFSCEVLYF